MVFVSFPLDVAIVLKIFEWLYSYWQIAAKIQLKTTHFWQWGLQKPIRLSMHYYFLFNTVAKYTYSAPNFLCRETKNLSVKTEQFFCNDPAENSDSF